LIPQGSGVLLPTTESYSESSNSSSEEQVSTKKHKGRKCKSKKGGMRDGSGKFNQKKLNAQDKHAVINADLELEDEKLSDLMSHLSENSEERFQDQEE
ncbi:MAG: hypothetical protein EZS28_026722, partial [Streblomastix strix]